MTKVLVTGGCGFIGANLVSILRKRNYDVRIFDNLSRGSVEFLNDPSYEVVQGDVRDESSVIEAAKGCDVIIHLAAFGSVVESVTEPEENYSVNAEGTFKVLNAARKAGIGRFVFASTGGALIGDAVPPVNEESVPRPISPYGASKLAGEGYCSAFASSYDMAVTALRFANVIGPISWHKKGAVTAFFKAIMQDEPITIFGDGSATRDFLYVGDLCNGIVSALESTGKGFNVYHLAGGREVSIKELAEIVLRVCDVEGHPVSFKNKRQGEVERNFAEFGKAQRELGFRPATSLEEALEITWKWFQHEAENKRGIADSR